MEVQINVTFTQATSTFHPFSALPYELRRKIWEYSLSTNKIIEVIYQRSRHRWQAARTSQVPNPLFLTCHESSIVAKEVLIRCFGAWFNLSSDTLWMNSLKKSDFVDRFFQFGRHVNDICLGGDPEDDGDEQKKFRLLFRLKRLMITWDLWAEANLGVTDPRISEERSAEFACMEGLAELIFVMVEYVKDEQGRLIPDKRPLTDEDLQEVSGARNSRIVREANEMVERSLRCMDGRVQFEFKAVKRGDDGEGGARADLSPFDLRFLRGREDLAAEETEQEEKAAAGLTA